MQDYEIHRLAQALAKEMMLALIGDEDEQEAHRADHRYVREQRAAGDDRRVRFRRVSDQVMGVGLIALLGGVLAWVGWGFMHWLGLR